MDREERVSAPVVRELRTTDLRCDYCGVGSGEQCIHVVDGSSHYVRWAEWAGLRLDGWDWQERSTRDVGSSRSK